MDCGLNMLLQQGIIDPEIVGKVVIQLKDKRNLSIHIPGCQISITGDNPRLLPINKTAFDLRL